jgi:Cu-processing system ATP-binding protein
VVQAVGLKKRFGSLQVLNGIDLTVSPGEVVAIIGPNASGKTTLLKCILGLVYPDAGQVRIDGVDTTRDFAWRRRLGYMPQAVHFPEAESPRHLLALIERLHGEPARRRDELLGTLDLTRFLKKPVRALSGGTRQKLNIVMGLMHEPALLVCDEPTAGLDPASSSRFRELIQGVRQRGGTALLTSHYISELEGMAERIVFLLEGRVFLDQTPEQLYQRTGERRLERAIAKLLES